jgi:dTDP-glucose 4,6-dehydratase
MKVVVTGGAGFIGSNLVSELLLSDLNIKELHVIDKLSYAGSLANLGTNLDLPNVFFHKEDICDQSVMSDLLKDVDYIFNLAAESHVDRSITDAAAFWNSNVLGTVSLLESIKNRPGVRFLHVSTDEVYGSTSEGKFMETDPIKPSSPYSASKAASDLACMAYSHTYGVDYLITLKNSFLSLSNRLCTANLSPYMGMADTFASGSL